MRRRWFHQPRQRRSCRDGDRLRTDAQLHVAHEREMPRPPLRGARSGAPHSQVPPRMPPSAQPLRHDQRRGSWGTSRAIHCDHSAHALSTASSAVSRNRTRSASMGRACGGYDVGRVAGRSRRPTVRGRRSTWRCRRRRRRWYLFTDEVRRMARHARDPMDRDRSLPAQRRRRVRVSVRISGSIRTPTGRRRETWRCHARAGHTSLPTRRARPAPRTRGLPARASARPAVDVPGRGAAVGPVEKPRHPRSRSGRRIEAVALRSPQSSATGSLPFRASAARPRPPRWRDRACRPGATL